MRSHFMLNRSVALACAVSGATGLMTDNASAQTLVAADYATNSAYADGWQEGDNGGFGFTAWSMSGTYSSPIQHSMTNSSCPYNQLGLAWTIYNPAGKEPNVPNGDEGTDISRAGRGIPALQIGQTITTVFDNPTERFYWRGYTIRLVSGGQNVTYGGTAVTRLGVGTFEYNTNGRWYGLGEANSVYDTNTAAGTELAVTMVGPNNYRLVMTPLNNPANAYTNIGVFEGTGPIDWIQFEIYNTDSDFFPTPVEGAQETDFYVRSITISEIQVIPPSIAQQPVSQALYAGRTARFKAVAIGTSPSYQWRKNGVNVPNGGNISGALTDSLVISNMTAGDVATYTLVVTNSAGAVTSAPVTLTLVSPSGTAYENAVVAANPIAHWRLNEIASPSTNPPAYDFVGSFAGTYGSGTTNGSSSIAGPLPSEGFYGFESGNKAVKTTVLSDQSWVTVPPLNLNTDTVTVTAWIYPEGYQWNFCGLFVTGDAAGRSGLTYGGWQGGNQDMLAYLWGDGYWNWPSYLNIPSDVWSLVALVVEPTQGTLYLYNTADQSSVTNVDSHGSVPWARVGAIGADIWDPKPIEHIFNGRIDEVAVFNYALAPAQIQNLYNAAFMVTLNIEKVGSNVRLTWPLGTLLEANDVTGGWTTNSAASPYTFPPGGSKKFYRVVR